MVTYASRSRKIIRFNGAYTRRRIYNTIGRIRALGRGTRLGRALTYTRLNLFRGKPKCGRRRVLIVVTTGGRSLDRVRKPAEALKGAGVEIFMVGRIGRSLLRVTTDRKHVFVVRSTRLLSIVRTLKDRICYSPGKLTIKRFPVLSVSFQKGSKFIWIKQIVYSRKRREKTAKLRSPST